MIKANALILVQQRELYRLQQRINYYKKEIYKSNKHLFKIKNNNLFNDFYLKLYRENIISYMLVSPEYRLNWNE